MTYRETPAWERFLDYLMMNRAPGYMVCPDHTDEALFYVLEADGSAALH